MHAHDSISSLECGDIAPNPGPSTEDYMLLPKFRDRVLKTFGCAKPHRDAFAARHNRQFPLFWSVADNAVSKDWNGDVPLWMNPPFTLLPAVARKLGTDGGHCVLIAPEWSPALPALQGMAANEYLRPAVPKGDA
jgi:hypothetical protein